MSAPFIGIAGSLRQGSYNRALLQAAAEAAPPDMPVHVASIRGIPLYDGDVEKESGIPENVKGLKDQIAGSAGILLVTPEYNNSIPGVLKNAVDWLSRPAADIPRVWGSRPVAVLGTTTGRGGTVLAQTAWLPVLRTLGTRPWWGPRIQLPGAESIFDSAGRLVDEKVRAQLVAFMAGFAAFTRSS